MGGRGAASRHSKGGAGGKNSVVRLSHVHTRNELNKMSLNRLREVAAQTATAYYKSGRTGISFGGADPSAVARRLVTSGSKASLKKDVLSMQKKMKSWGLAD